MGGGGDCWTWLLEEVAGEGCSSESFLERWRGHDKDCECLTISREMMDYCFISRYGQK